MEGPAGGGAAAGGGALSGTEKEKVQGRAGSHGARGGGRGGAGPSPVRCVLQLREKLALLRREYSETVSRLRRARRAERARSHGRGAAAEGGRRERGRAGRSRQTASRFGLRRRVRPEGPAGCRVPPLPSGGLQCSRVPTARSQSSAPNGGVSLGPRDDVSPGADKHDTSQLQPETCSDPDTEKTTPVTFQHVPESAPSEAGCPASSQAGGIQASQDKLCCGTVRPAPGEQKPQTNRSLLKLRRRTKTLVSEEQETVREVYAKNAGDTGRNQAASTGELGSAVFRRSTLSNTEGNTQGVSDAALVWREENGFTPPDAVLGAARDVLEDSVPPGAPERLSCARRGSRDVRQPESSGATAAPDNHEPAQPCSGNGDSVLLGIGGGGGKESSGLVKQTDSERMCEDQGELHGLSDLTAEGEVSPAGGSSNVITDGKSHEVDQGDTSSLHPFPAHLALGNVEALLENQQLESQSRLSHPEKVTAPESALNSCTVVEGLLFPVEYYVRTTRRMSNCQRKVDLDAVILSQLGRSKKSQRSKCKQKGANSDQPSQERVETDLETGVTPFPFLGAENGSGSPQRSPPVSSGSSTSLGSISQNSLTSSKRDRRRSQRKRKRTSACKPCVRQASQELVESVDLVTPRESSSLLFSECQSERENCEANLEESSSDGGRLSAAPALGAGETEGTGATQPADPLPGGSQVLGRCRQTSLEQVQNPLQDGDSLNPGTEAFGSQAGDLEANPPACRAEKQPAEHPEGQHVRGACRAQQLLAVDVPLRRSLRSSARQRASQDPKGESKRGCVYPAGSEDPASLGLPALDPDTSDALCSFRSLQRLIPRLGITDFHLPDEEFGLLKLEKFEPCPETDLEVFVPRVFGGGAAPGAAQVNPEEKRLGSSLISPFKNGSPKLPHVESPASKKELSTHELLLTPVGTVVAGTPESQISSSIFPAVGATPAVLPSACNEVFPKTPSVPPSQASLHPSDGAPAQVVGDGECKDSAVALRLDGRGAGSAGTEEERGTACPSEAERGPDSQSGAAVALEKHQQPESKRQRSCRASPEQKKGAAEEVTAVVLDGLTEESLELVSKLKDSSSSCAVDVSTMWWEAAGSRELCVVTACESSVSLWKPLASDGWGKVYTWQLGEIPVIQIVPLPDTCNLVCIALGDLEIGEIRLLLYSPESGSFQQSLVKAGPIKAVVGLRDRRLVSSSRTVQEQQVEAVFLSETGRSKDGQTLMPPEETVLAFAEVEGMRDALVGSTAANSIVVWNLKSGQLLKKMHVGYSYPASICHRAYSDSGLLFVVLSHPHAKESESHGNPAFRLVAFNPRTARSAGVTASSPPPRHAGRQVPRGPRVGLGAMAAPAERRAWRGSVSRLARDKGLRPSLPFVLGRGCNGPGEALYLGLPGELPRHAALGRCRQGGARGAPGLPDSLGVAEQLPAALAVPWLGWYLEGDVGAAAAAAVLTSGAVAVWDLLLGRCTALLPPGPRGSWVLARWATAGACLLAGQRDGTVCLYRYRQPQRGAA
ncbi:partner and localizer of BRCA2 [Rhynochetos jubatus]